MFTLFSVKISQNGPEMLSLGALQNVYEGRNEDDMVVQVLGVKQLPGAEEKYRINISSPSQANEKKATLTTVKQTTVQPREKESRMINKAKEFLEKASKEKDKEAEKKLEEENRCAMCKKLHNCSK